MYCRICGTDQSVKYRRGPRMNMCGCCSKDTPKKSSYENFNKRYWSDPRLVTESVKRSFYNDYKTSMCNLEQYIDQTTDILY